MGIKEAVINHGSIYSLSFFIIHFGQALLLVFHKLVYNEL